MELAAGNHRCWGKGLQSILRSYQCEDMWRVDHTNCSEIESRLKEAFEIESRISTLIEIESKPSLRFYRSFPIWWDFERDHLTLPVNLRRAILSSRLNSSSLVFRINTISGKEKRCILCRTALISDENWSHILWDCTELELERQEAFWLGDAVVDLSHTEHRAGLLFSWTNREELLGKMAFR